MIYSEPQNQAREFFFAAQIKFEIKRAQNCLILYKMKGEELYRRYSARLAAYAFGICGDQELAKDAVSETFVEYLKNPPLKDSASWFYMVCRNKLLNRIRRERKMSPAPDEDFARVESPHLSPSQTLEAADARKRLRQMLKSLRPRECEAISLKYFEDFSYAQIAEIMNMSVSGVGTLIFRGMEN